MHRLSLGAIVTDDSRYSPERLHVINASNDCVQSSRIFSALLKFLLVGALVRAGPLHFKKVRPGHVHQADWPVPGSDDTDLSESGSALELHRE
jgi:hypothetical protein